MDCIAKIDNYTGTSNTYYPNEFNCDFSTLEPHTSTYRKLHGIGWDTIEADIVNTCNARAGPLTLFGLKSLNLSVTRKLTTLLSSLFIIWAIGTKVSFSKCSANFKRPYGIIIGWLSQYGIMPLVALALITVYSNKVTIHQKFAIFLAGCAPGGNLSSLLVYWIKGDLNLSVAMTLASQLCCIVMVPLLIRLYTPLINDTNYVKIKTLPASRILLSSVPIILPLFLGYLCRRKYRKFCKKWSPTATRIGVLFITISLVLAIISDPTSFKKQIQDLVRLTPIVGLMPITGMLMGYCFAALTAKLFSKCFEFNHVHYKTIAIETGIQNLVLPNLIIQLNFDCPAVLVEMLSAGLAYFFSQMGTLVLVFMLYKIHECMGPQKGLVDDSLSSTGDETRSDESLMINSSNTSSNMVPQPNVLACSEKHESSSLVIGSQPQSTIFSQGNYVGVASSVIIANEVSVEVPLKSEPIEISVVKMESSRVGNENSSV